jgi:hypothetical protein
MYYNVIVMCLSCIQLLIFISSVTVQYPGSRYMSNSFCFLDMCKQSICRVLRKSLTQFIVFLLSPKYKAEGRHSIRSDFAFWLWWWHILTGHFSLSKWQWQQRGWQDTILTFCASDTQVNSGSQWAETTRSTADRYYHQCLVMHDEGCCHCLMWLYMKCTCFQWLFFRWDTTKDTD